MNICFILTGCKKDEKEELKDKVVSELGYVNIKIIDMLNALKRMKFIQINSTVDLVSGFHGIREPEISDSSVIYPEQEDTSQGTLVIMPGVAFDHYRNRIGYNGGFYDTFLEKHKEISKIAIAFQVQISDRIIVPEDHDIKPDLIITEFSQYAV